MSAKEPKGIIAIWTDPEGNVIATEADFDRSGYGGCKLWEAQRMRVNRAIAWSAVRAYCSPAVTDALTSYLLEQIAREMRNKGHKVTLREIGWGADVAEVL